MAKIMGSLKKGKSVFKSEKNIEKRLKILFNRIFTKGENYGVFFRISKYILKTCKKRKDFPGIKKKSFF